MKPILYYIKHPQNVLAPVFMKTCWWMPDKPYLQIFFLLKMGKKLHLKHPKSYNEKLQWLKLYNHQPEYTKMVDKYAVKDYVAGIIGKEYVIPTLGVWDKPEDIDWNTLPEKFVLKTTHGGGSVGVVICRDKSTFDKGKAIRNLNKSLSQDINRTLREYPYKNVNPRIIAEKYMADESGTELKDYKIFCFDGVPLIIQVDYDRFVKHKRNLYDTEWNRLPFTLKFPTDWNREFDKPKNLDKMLEIAAQLSAGYPHLRVDLYNINGVVYFGELTFFHGSGFEKFTPEEWDYIFGSWIELPNVIKG